MVCNRKELSISLEFFNLLEFFINFGNHDASLIDSVLLQNYFFLFFKKCKHEESMIELTSNIINLRLDKVTN